MLSLSEDDKKRIHEHLLQGETLIHQNELRRALEILGPDFDLIKDDQSPPPQIYYSLALNLADIHMNLRHFEIAERLSRECRDKLGDKTPELVVKHCENILANLYVRTARFGEAETAITNYIRLSANDGGELEPTLAPQYHLLVISYCATGRFDEAERVLGVLKQIERNVIRDGHPDRANICNSVISASNLLTLAKDAGVAVPASSICLPSDQDGLQREEEECWRHFCRHDFVFAAAAAVRLLGTSPSIRVIEVWLLSRLWIGEDIRQVGDDVAGLALTDLSCRAMMEFTLGKLPLEGALRLMKTAAHQCRTWFYGGMIGLLNRNEAQARDCLARAVEFEIDLPERRQASIELEALDYLARDLSCFDDAVQKKILAAYRDFADCNWMDFLKKTGDLAVRNSMTPQLLLLQIAGFRALAQQDFVAFFVPHARRQLLHWTWHARMVDLITGRISFHVLFPTVRGAVETCQLRYYTLVAERLSGHFEEAELHRTEALRAAAECAERALVELDSANPRVMIENINRQVKFLADRGELEMAEIAARGGLAMARRLPGVDGSEVGDLVGNLAAVLGMSGKLSESLQLFEEIRSSPTIGEENRLGFSLNLGQLYLEHDMLPESEVWLERAWDIGQKTAPEGRNLSVLYNALGRLAQQKQDFSGADRWYALAAEQLRDNSSSDRLLLAVITDNTGTNLALSHKYQEALTQHQRAAEILKSIDGAHLSRIKVLMNMAWVLDALGRHEEAQGRALEALERCGYPEKEANPLTSRILSQLAISYYASGKTKEALDVLITGSRVADRQFGEAMSLSSDDLRMSYSFSALFELSLLLTVARDKAAGMGPRLEKVLDTVLRRKALVAEASIAMRDVVLGGRYPSLQPLLEELHKLRNQVALMALGAESENQPTSYERDITAKRDRLRALEASLAKEIPELRVDRVLREVKAQRVLRGLPADWSIVEFVRAPICNFFASLASDDFFGPEHYFAFVIPSGKIEHLRLMDLGTAAELDAIIREFLANLSEYGTSRAMSPGDAIRERLVRPLFSLFPPSGHILIALDGFVAQLPFEVLPGLDCTFLIDNYSFSYVTTIRDVLRSSIAESTPQTHDVVIGDPDFGEYCDDSKPPGTGGFDQLPGTRAEAKAVAEALGVDPWLGADASKTRLIRLVSPRLLHIATHGFRAAESGSGRPSYRGRVRGFAGISLRLNIDDSLLRSGLALARANIGNRGGPAGLDADDGLLTASDVMAMNLLGTQLVVLSACDSARGTRHPTEGIIGIRRAFQLAGARTVIASLWKLPDDQTSTLMQGLYQRLRRGISCSEALRAAQLELRNSFPCPFYWGAFVCFGNAGRINGMEMAWGGGEQSNRHAAQLQEDAIRKLSLVLEHDSFNSEALMQRGICYHNLYRYVEALADFDQALELSPNLPELLYSRGLSYHAFGRPEKAISDFNRVLELDVGYGKAYHHRGLSFLRLGDDEAALQDFARAIVLLPADADVRYNRGGYFADRDMFQKALSDYSEAIRLRPTFEVAYVNRATVLMGLGEIEAAISDLLTAVELDPRDALAHLNLGSALAMNGKTDEALECWKAAMQHGTADIIVAAQQMTAKLSSKRGAEVGPEEC